ncbi:MAG TPA: hypothetical protein QGH92_00990 [Candidatus Parcubacteria bacterium]|jgi:hypothetical protein|nr:hypothetical protein [Parcubacteria group bacterium]HJN62165.1 hypothetical protein [Candidatus Parcubacteria bacterium]|tara:strand:- start:239 stop:568 length:330 start_codon:yes stop_codon:yes gene_type:complete
MIKNVLLLVLFFYFLAVFQAIFLIRFNFPSEIFNLILISVVLLAFFEKPLVPGKSGGYLSIFGAIIGGFFWDIFSPGLFGFHIFFLLGLTLLIKLIFWKYVQIPIIKRV